MGRKKDKKKKEVIEETVVEEPQPEPIPEPPKSEPIVPEGVTEFFGEGEKDNRKDVVKFCNELINLGFTVDIDWEHNPRTNIYEYIYYAKKVG